MSDNEGISNDQLRLLVERVERLEEEKRGIADDIKDVCALMESVGYDATIVREIVRLRRMEKTVRDERRALIETYGEQLGLF